MNRSTFNMGTTLSVHADSDLSKPYRRVLDKEQVVKAKHRYKTNARRGKDLILEFQSFILLISTVICFGKLQINEMRLQIQNAQPDLSFLWTLRLVQTSLTDQKSK